MHALHDMSRKECIFYKRRCNKLSRLTYIYYLDTYLIYFQIKFFLTILLFNISSELNNYWLRSDTLFFMIVLHNVSKMSAPDFTYISIFEWLTHYLKRF